MARDFDKTTTNYLDLGTGGINPVLSGASALSIHAWVNFDTTDIGANDNRIVNIDIDADSTGIALIINGVDGLNSVRIAGRSVSTDAIQAKNGAAGLAASTWHSVGGVMDIGGDAITPYQNGVADGGGAVTFGNTTYTTGTPTIVDQISGGRNPPTTTNMFDGRIAEVAIWTVDIGAAGFATLGDGFSALFVRPESLVFYMPLIGRTSPEIEIISGKNGTIAGTVANAVHPRIIYPSPAQIRRFGGIAGTSISPSISPSLSPSISPSQSPSASLSPSISPSISPSLSPSLSPSPSPPNWVKGSIDSTNWTEGSQQSTNWDEGSTNSSNWSPGAKQSTGWTKGSIESTEWD